jgi:polyferredoxin
MKLQLQPDRRMLRQFAWASLVLLPAVAFFLAWRHGLPTPWALAVGGVGVLVALAQIGGFLVSEALGAALEKAVSKPVFQGLMLVAYPIGLVVSTVLIGVIFYALITPIGLVFRLIGRDVMGKRLDKSAATYWHVRGAPRPATSYFKLY